MNAHKFYIVLLSFNIVCILSIAQSNKVVGSTFHPNNEIQSLLRGLLSPNEAQMFSGSEDELSQNLSRLNDLAVGDSIKIVQELLYFSMQSKSMREGMLPGFIIKEMNISKDDIVRGLLTHLEDDEKSQKYAYNWLGGVDYDPKGSTPEFKHYEKIIKEKESNVPYSLIRYMYEKNADQALRSMANVYLDKADANILLKKTKDLESLSLRQEWWIKFYIAEKLRGNPALQSEIIINRIVTSTNSLILESISQMDN